MNECISDVIAGENDAVEQFLKFVQFQPDTCTDVNNPVPKMISNYSVFDFY